MDENKNRKLRNFSLVALWSGLLLGGYFVESSLNKSVKYEISENTVVFNRDFINNGPDVIVKKGGFDEKYYTKENIDFSFDKEYELERIRKGTYNWLSRESSEDTLAKYESKLNRIRDSAYKISQKERAGSLNKAKGIEGLLGL